jgi:hypothetical protein
MEKEHGADKRGRQDRFSRRHGVHDINILTDFPGCANWSCRLGPRFQAAGQPNLLPKKKLAGKNLDLTRPPIAAILFLNLMLSSWIGR